MDIISPIKISYKNLLAAKFRSFLTILGIIIGVAAVVIIFAVGRSAQELILDQIRGIGSNLIGVLPGASEEEGPPAAAMGVIITTLKYDDLLEIRKKKNALKVRQSEITKSSKVINDLLGDCICIEGLKVNES